MEDPTADRTRDRVEELVAQYLERVERGEDRVLERLCTENREIAEALTQRVEKMDELRRWMGESFPGADPPAARRFGRYRIERALGRGGMGFVWLAFDPQLGRRVALKALTHAALATERDRTRFSREIRAIARLDHSHIVPMYEVGESNGVPFFAMQYIDGCTLAHLVHELGANQRPETLSGRDLMRVLAGRPPQGADSTETRPGDETVALEPAGAVQSRSYVQTVCGWILEIARALEHAHSHGVLHRDVKPSNILVNLQGHALLFDFGLARLTGEESLTHTGDFLGTPYYASPEQVAARRMGIDARTDVYSLGATLYELLTLRRPFRGNSTQQILKQILLREPQPIRQINPAVPRDLETICRTAMDKDPDRRYATAGELADDLQRFLELRPVEARPLGPVPRAWRWIRRNPAFATASALAFLLVVVGPLAFGLYYRGINAELRRERARTELLAERARHEKRVAQEQSRRARLEKQRAFAHLEVALDLGRSMFSASEQFLAAMPASQELRRGFVDEVAGALDRLLESIEGDPRVQFEAARTRRVRADLRSWLNDDPDTARRDYEQAIALFRELDRRAPEIDIARRQLAITLHNLAVHEMTHYAWESASRHLEEALALLEPLYRDDPSDTHREILVFTLVRHATLTAYRTGELERARAGFDRASRLAGEDATGALRLARGQALQTLGYLLTGPDRGNLIEAEQVLREAVEILDEGANQPDARLEQRQSAIAARYWLAWVLEASDQLDEARRINEVAWKRAERLALSGGDLPAFDRLAAACSAQEGRIASRLGEAVRAGEAYRQAADWLTRNPPPRGADELTLTARVYNSLAIHQAQIGQGDRACELYDRSAELWARIREQCPENAHASIELALVLSNRLWTGNGVGEDPNELLLVSERGLAALDELPASAPRERREAHLRSSLLDGAATCHLRLGEPDRALAMQRQAEQVIARAVESHPADVDLMLSHAWRLANLAQLLRRRQELSEAEAHARQAVALLDRLDRAGRAWTAAEGSSRVVAIQTLAGVLKDLDRLTESRRFYEDCLELRRALLASDPTNPVYQSNVGGALHNLALILERQGEVGRAFELFSEAKALQIRALGNRPDLSGARTYLCFHLERLAEHHLEAGRWREAANSAEELLREARAPEHSWSAVRVFARLADAAEDEVQRLEWRRRILETVEPIAPSIQDRIFVPGTPVYELLKGDPAFEALRDPEPSSSDGG